MFSLVFFLSFNQYKQVYYQKGEVVSLCSTLLTTSNNINTRCAKRILRNYKIHLSSRLSSCSIEKRTEINGVFCYHYEETYKPCIFNRFFFEVCTDVNTYGYKERSALHTVIAVVWV